MIHFPPPRISYKDLYDWVRNALEDFGNKTTKNIYIKVIKSFHEERTTEFIPWIPSFLPETITEKDTSSYEFKKKVIYKYSIFNKTETFIKNWFTWILKEENTDWEFVWNTNNFMELSYKVNKLVNEWCILITDLDKIENQK